MAGLGFGLPAARRRARELLEAAGLTRAGKTRMSNEKLEKAESLLHERVFLHCTQSECVGFAKSSGREPVLCEPRNTCERCGGSDNSRAVKDVIDACRQRGVTRLVIVGGSPTVRQELERLMTGSGLELRLVDGTKARPLELARGDLAWGDVVLLWGATELHHKVSNQYQDHATGSAKRKLIHVPRRGIAQVLAGLLAYLVR